ncbi:MAG: ribosome biosis GTPase / thiamine phosphate phosphatase [Frankiaceae bacterium]|nr:ribosome biosis GTPase / thiamine phosphate phosphatase [Frankiaceae bacterium]
MTHDTLASLGWDALYRTEFEPYADVAVPGRVVRVDRGAADVLTADNPVRVATDTTDEPLAVGDWVALVATDDRRWTVDTVLPRRGAIRRAAVTGESQAQVVAANLDVVLIAVPAIPEPRIGMVERMVALAWDSGATPVVVLTKADLVSDPETVVADLAASAPGVDVVAVSAATDGGLDALAGYLQDGRTVCLLGRSGAGKSTLANALLGAEHLATRDIRSDGKGRHTTTHRELVVLPGGGCLIDTPGLKGVGLWLGDDGLDRAFADIEELVPHCRFSDCRHETEPGCAVLGAIDAGTLPERRLASWRKLQREAVWIAARTDARLRAEQSKKWRAIHQEVRRSGRIRP